MPDYDNPEVEKQWIAKRREEIARYLQDEGVSHGIIGETCMVCGSFRVSAQYVHTPRQAMASIASLWKEASEHVFRGERHPTFVIGNGENSEEISPLLASRAPLLLEWANDPDSGKTNSILSVNRPCFRQAGHLQR